MNQGEKSAFALKSRVGTFGPFGITEEQQKLLKAGKGTQFKMYDDDHILVYTGRLLGDPNSEEGFGPLDDFGMPDAGCTGIKYRSPNGGFGEYL